MGLENRIARLEDWRRRERGRRPETAEAATDAELETAICDAIGCAPTELTDELLEAVARGER